ncbi:MAG: HNH endonuclease, partial [Nitrospirae bacterium]|nr:HNH endonuclease [Nitrospirota bacterium]
PISQKLRYAILKRDREQCVKRGASPKKNSEVTLEVDHIIPVAEGGTNDPKNLQTLCWSCNQGKTDAPN